MATGEEAEEGRPPLTHHPSPSHGGRRVIGGAFLGVGEQGLIPSVLHHVSPVPKARDADQLDDVDPYLTEKYKEEHEEAERVVRLSKHKYILLKRSANYCNLFQDGLCCS